MQVVGLFYDHLVYYTAIWYILWPYDIYYEYLEYLFPFWYVVPRKIWQPCTGIAGIPRVGLSWFFSLVTVTVFTYLHSLTLATHSPCLTFGKGRDAWKTCQVLAPGVNVMITTFSEKFDRISAGKIGDFLENQWYDYFFAQTSTIFGQDRPFFRPIFRRKCLKNHNIDPRYPFRLRDLFTIGKLAKKSPNWRKKSPDLVTLYTTTGN
jgi:hypothetical protein